MSIVLVGVIAYVALQLLIGFVIGRRIRTEDDYLVAGRRLGYGLATFSIFATWFGAETCIGSAGEIYRSGLSGGHADPFGYTICLLLLGLLLAAPLWRRKIVTLADLFRNRFSISVERAAVLVIAPSSLLWAAAQIRAFGQVLSASSELALGTAITIAAAVVILYTAFGGLMADAVTDVVQGSVLIVGLTVLFILVIGDLGGPAEAFAAVPAERWNPFAGEGGVLLKAEAWLTPILGSLVAQELASRVSASRSEHVARRSSYAAASLYLLIGLLPATLGLVGTLAMPALADPEQLLPQLAREHFSTFFYVLFAGALVSAILSTVDSALLAASSLVSHNLVVSVRSGITEAQKVRLARIFVVLFGIIAYVMAFHAEGIYSLVEEASAFGGAGILTILMFGLFSTYGGPGSAMTALGASVVTWLVGFYLFSFDYAFLLSLAVAVAAYGLVGVVERKKRIPDSA